MPVLGLLSGLALNYRRPVGGTPEAGVLTPPTGWVQTLDEPFSRAATFGVEALDPAIWKQRSFGGSAHNGSSTWDEGAQTQSTGTTIRIHSRNVNGAWKVDGFLKGIQNTDPAAYGYDKGYLQFHARTRIRLSHAIAPGVGGYALFWQADNVWGSELDILEAPGRIKNRADATMHWDSRGQYDLQTNDEQSTSEVSIDLTQWNDFDMVRTFTFGPDGTPKATIQVAINGILMQSKEGWTDNQWLCKPMVPGYASYVAPDIPGVRDWYGLPTSETPADTWIEVDYLKIWEPEAGSVPITKSISFAPSEPGTLTPAAGGGTVTWNTTINTTGITNLSYAIVSGPPTYAFRTITDTTTTGSKAVSIAFQNSGEFVKAYETGNIQAFAVDSGAVTIGVAPVGRTLTVNPFEPGSRAAGVLPTTVTTTGISSITWAVVNPGTYSWAMNGTTNTSGSVVINPNYTATGQFLKVFDTNDYTFVQDCGQVTIV